MGEERCARAMSRASECGRIVADGQLPSSIPGYKPWRFLSRHNPNHSGPVGLGGNRLAGVAIPSAECGPSVLPPHPGLEPGLPGLEVVEDPPPEELLAQGAMQPF